MERLVLSVDEAAEALGISSGTVYLLIRERHLPAVRLGAKRLLVPVKALERFLSDKASEATGAREGEDRLDG